MKKSSIFYSITFIFLFAALGVYIGYLNLLKYDKQKYTQELNERYSIVSRVTLLKFLNHPDLDTGKLKDELHVYKMQLIEEPKRVERVLKEGELLQKITTRIGSSSIYYFRKNNYLWIEAANGKSILLEDHAFRPYRTQILYIKLIFAGILLGLFLTYLWTIRKIKPIKKIKAEIDKFASGNLDIDCRMDTNDEIAEVGNAFTHAVEQIRALNNSRRLFLRNIMHELKTPITKGMISAEMLQEGKQKERLISVFQRLESLLNEFSAIEQITIDGSHLKKRIYRLVDVIDEAIDLSMADPKNIETTLQKDLTLKVDFKLFSIAIKNMIDNGIKYSEDGHVQIYANSHAISFLSKGDKLEHPLSYYTEPFTQGSQSDRNSFGLGLYIVDSILKAHHLKLEYDYQDGYNIFKFSDLMPIL